MIPLHASQEGICQGSCVSQVVPTTVISFSASSRTAFLPGFVPAEGLHVDVLSQMAPAQPSSWPILDLVVAAEIGEGSQYPTLQ